MSATRAPGEEDTYVRRNALIAFLWVLGMVLAGVGLVVFSDAFQSAF